MVTKKLLGTIGVDAGLIFITDPCYIRRQPQLYDGTKWDDFCKNFYDRPDGDNHKEMLSGVAVNTRDGDGSFGVYGIYDKGGELMRVEIDFMKMV
jgi:hypothetical protein